MSIISTQLHVRIMSTWNINPESLLRIPGKVWIYWKDIHGFYLGSNDKMAEVLNHSCRQDIIGKTDYDFSNLTQEGANKFVSIDQLVMNNCIVHHSHDVALLKNSKMYFHTLKMPLYKDHKKLVGVLGISYYQEEKNIYDFSYPIGSLLNSLSRREHEVLHHLIRGATAKKIAKLLGISVRTTEWHLVNIRNKLNVTTKSELIEKVIDYI